MKITLERIVQDAKADAKQNNVSLTIWNLNRFNPLYVIRTYREGDEHREQFVMRINPQTL